MIKRYLYFKSKDPYKTDNSSQWKRKTLIASFVPFSLILFLIGTTINNNDLHKLPLLKNGTFVTKGEFVDNIRIDSTQNGYFALATYGGGLKANVWTMNILHELRSRKHGDKLFQSLLCASGASGGTLGIGCYTMINSHTDVEDGAIQRKYIDSISRMNALSSDISGWLWKDLIREILPNGLIWNDGNDRAHESMLNYSLRGESDSGTIVKETFREYWRKVYDRKDHFYPAIIVNTTPTRSRYGVACSVEGFDRFPIMIDILDHEDKSLSFGGAISTSNRFPLFSPAARIEGKGHFVDGGMFENSGLMNALSFYQELQTELKENQQRDSLFVINIMNDQTNFILNIASIADEMKDHNAIEPYSAEWSAIGLGLAAQERMPYFFREKIQNDPKTILLTINMPFIITEDNVKKAYHTTADLPSRVKVEIKSENMKIIQALQEHDLYDYENWGIVEPPLGRLMSLPAVEYQKAMIKNHEDVKSSIDAIMKKIVVQ